MKELLGVFLRVDAIEQDPSSPGATLVATWSRNERKTEESRKRRGETDVRERVKWNEHVKIAIEKRAWRIATARGSKVARGYGQTRVWYELHGWCRSSVIVTV